MQTENQCHQIIKCLEVSELDIKLGKYKYDGTRVTTHVPKNKVEAYLHRASSPALGTSFSVLVLHFTFFIISTIEALSPSTVSGKWSHFSLFQVGLGTAPFLRYTSAIWETQIRRSFWD